LQENSKVGRGNLRAIKTHDLEGVSLVAEHQGQIGGIIFTWQHVTWRLFQITYSNDQSM